MGNYKSKNPNADATAEERIYPEPSGYKIRTRPPVMEGNTWKQNVQLKIREEQLADESMPVARYFLVYLGENVMIHLWSILLALRGRAYFGWSSIVRNSFSMWLSARRENTTSKWTKREET